MEIKSLYIQKYIFWGYSIILELIQRVDITCTLVQSFREGRSNLEPPSYTETGHLSSIIIEPAVTNMWRMEVGYGLSWGNGLQKRLRETLRVC